MTPHDLPPPPLGRGLLPWHLLAAALGSSGLTALIVVAGLAGRGEDVERSVSRGIAGGVEQALAPAVVHDRSARAGRGLVEGLVDGALDQVDGPRGEAVLGRTLDAGARLTEVGLDAGLEVGLGMAEALGGPAPAPARPRVAPVRRDDVAPVETTSRGRVPAREAGRLAEEVLDLGFDLVDDVLGTRLPARRSDADGGAPERARAGRAGGTRSDAADDGSSREAGERSRRTHHTDDAPREDARDHDDR